MGDFTYKVNVKATVSDEASGNVFAMLMSANLDAPAIQSQVNDHTGNMVLLGSFSGLGGAPLEGNLTTYFADVSNVIDNTPITLGPDTDIEYYVYIYAIDQYGNDILLKRPEAITLDIDSTTVTEATLFIGTKTGLFHETRDSTDITQATVTSSATDGSNYFGYSANKISPDGTYTDYANVLYATLIANPGEFVVDAVYSFAVETPPATIAGNEANFLTLIESMDPAKDYSTFTDPVNLLFVQSESFPYEIDTFYANVYSNVKYPMVFGTNYTLYHACHVRDMDLYVINQSDNVSTGEAPTIVSSTAIVTGTEQEFITDVSVTYDTGTVTVTTTLTRGSDIGDKDLYLYTAAFGYAEYDHAALLANLDTVFDVQNIGSSTSSTITLSQVYASDGTKIDASETNAVFVYQFASVGRDADEIALGAPTSNVTDFDGGSLIRSTKPQVTYDDAADTVKLYHYAEDFDHLTFKVKADTPGLDDPAAFESFARDLLVRYSEAVIDPSPKSYAITWTSTVSIDDTTNWKTGQTDPNYYATESLTYYYLEITQGSSITFTVVGGHTLFESNYVATTNTFTRQFISSPYQKRSTITFDDPGLRGFNSNEIGHDSMNLVVKTIPSAVHRGRLSKGVVSSSIDMGNLRSAFDNLLDVNSTANLPADGSVETINFVITLSILTNTTEITQFPPPPSVYINVEVLSVRKYLTIEFSELALYKVTYTDAELLTFPVDRDSTEDIVWKYGDSQIEHQAWKNSIYDGNTNSAVYAQRPIGYLSYHYRNVYENTIDYTFKLKSDKRTDVFTQLAISSHLTSLDGLPTSIKLYGGQTLEEAQAKTKLLQTLSLTYPDIPVLQTYPPQLWVFDLTETTPYARSLLI